MNNLRHSFASQHLIAGTPPLEVSKLMGHSTPDKSLPPEFVKFMREAQGFFKHADRDPPDKVLEFQPEMTKPYLLETVRLAYWLTGRVTPECGGLVQRAIVACPDAFEIHDSPALQMNRERLSRTLKPDDFERVLYLIDHPH